jgi:pyruvate/2-oxoglutarate dehydrogenase complex dihydrolipoamide dehydrogenase (E3) component
VRRQRPYDLAIIGGGAAGSEAAFAVADGGRSKILLAEANHFGGTCTNHGCVPTKALVRTARLLHLIRDADRYGINVGAPEVEWRRAIAYVTAATTTSASQTTVTHRARESLDGLSQSSPALSTRMSFLVPAASR